MADVSLQKRLEEATADIRDCENPSDVFDLLQREEISGSRKDCRKCPLAILVSKRLGPGFIVEVDWYLVQAYVDITVEDATVLWPPPVVALISRFDDGEDYQELAVVSHA